MGMLVAVALQVAFGLLGIALKLCVCAVSLAFRLVATAARTVVHIVFWAIEKRRTAKVGRLADRTTM